MNKLKSSYIKRAVVYPLFVLAGLIITATIVVPKFIASLPVATDKVHAVTQYNVEDYDMFPTKYNSFSELKHNRFVGWLSSEDAALGCAITYDSEDESTEVASLIKGSTEPWNDGCVMIVGKNSDAVFRNLHKSKIGNKIDVEFYENSTYTYKISSVDYMISRDEIKNFKKKNSLVMCLPYVNFAENGSFYYTVYVADLIGERGAENE
ncbi:sortase domain-bontaining protein [uncultured Eubacterium sp.]|uniref:sortase domain-containing protein n=1 Tax=uncultured Eubacterium sp. TaxID=165185 RepID=UPI00261A1725|nr:sortase [uncultured Eubacterium sp.]